jgi:hypothetical protein
MLKNKSKKKPCFLDADFLFTLLLNAEDRRDIFFRNVHLFTELHGLIFQKIELSTVRTVRTSNFLLFKRWERIKRVQGRILRTPKKIAKKKYSKGIIVTGAVEAHRVVRRRGFHFF